MDHQSITLRIHLLVDNQAFSLTRRIRNRATGRGKLVRAGGGANEGVSTQSDVSEYALAETG